MIMWRVQLFGVVFTTEDCKNIINFCSKYPVEDATVHSSDILPKPQITPSEKTSFTGYIIRPNNQHLLFNKILAVRRQSPIKSIGRWICMDSPEPLQFTHYKGGGDHYGWHLDLSTKNLSKRKLSVSIQLSDP
jgi:hypothetical protein